MSELKNAVMSALQQVNDPSCGRDLVSLQAVEKVDVDSAGAVQLQVVMGYPITSVSEQLQADIEAAVSAVAGVSSVALDLGWLVPTAAVQEGKQALPTVKHILCVASGKGGVGKSTTTVNLALALAAEGAKVGILDADIYGPSQPQMLGVADQKPQLRGQQHMMPIEAYGVEAISMGFLIDENTPMVWRGPMVTGALQQLLNQTLWGELDYLLIDMPPGTGDIQLSLSQQVPVSGSVIVTTPQDIALLDAKKGIEMFRKVNIPVLGVVENMATHICSNCGHEEHVFGAGGGERIASEYQTELLGALPLDLSIRENADGGKPSVAAEPDSAISQTYRQVARSMSARLWADMGQQQVPEIVISND